MSEITIQTNSDVPIYRQLVGQVHRLAAAGRLTAGERLPSVRQLAEELAINPMTVSKAYGLLEQDGLLERQRGIGMVMRSETRSPEELLAPTVDALITQASQLRIDQDSVVNMIQSRWPAIGTQTGKEKKP